MLIYLLTNKDTHARAVIVAESPLAARHTRPDERAQWDPRSQWWRRYDHTGHRFLREPPVPWWPEDVARVVADPVGYVATEQWNAPQVLAFNPDATLRKPGEGPDDSWGERYLELSKARR